MPGHPAVYSLLDENEFNTLQEAEMLLMRLTRAIGDAGLRVGEAIGLLWKDVDFKRKVLNIRRQGSEGAKTKTRKTRQVENFGFAL